MNRRQQSKIKKKLNKGKPVTMWDLLLLRKEVLNWKPKL